MQCVICALLRVLKKCHQEERDDRCRGVDDQVPGVDVEEATSVPQPETLSPRRGVPAGGSFNRYAAGIHMR